MKMNRDIELSRLSMALTSAMSRIAFLEEKVEKSVSRELYEATVAELNAEKSLRQHVEIAFAERIAELDSRYQSELAAKDRELSEYREVQALLKTENADFKTLWEFWQRHHFGASSETMTDMMDRMVGRLPSGKTAMPADIMSFIDRSGHDGWSTPVQKNKDISIESGNVRRKNKGAKCRKPGGARCMDVREIFGPDFSDLPSDVKVIMRKGKPDTTVIEMLFIERARAYSKKYTIARCNVPGSDPMNTKYPMILQAAHPAIIRNTSMGYFRRRPSCSSCYMRMVRARMRYSSQFLRIRR